jgi:tRNA-Thr(GGU) m(6)t(6)A37 methyltransferase TsaA
VEYRFEPIGIVHSCFTGKFGIPRQPRLVTAARSHLELFPEFARDEAYAALDGFSHLWLIFVFHDCIGAGWKPTVRPPRLGGQRKVGLFASRAPYRPNPIGISAVENLGLERSGGRLYLKLSGADLLDRTPVLDIKPYVPYADAIPDARAGFARKAPGIDRPVRFSSTALDQIAIADPSGSRQLELLITQILKQDPRPGYMDRYPERTEFRMRLYELNVRWIINSSEMQVVGVEQAEANQAHREIPGIADFHTNR